jgi:membrane-bound lytic murein transglycosylase MltF
MDNHKAWFWNRVLSRAKLHPTVIVRTGGQIAWAIRKDSPQLKTALNSFLATNGRNSLSANIIFRKYLLNTQYVSGAAAESSRKRFTNLVALFRKYGAQYNLDWMLMAAQGYQESRLNHAARSRVGAVGVMQVLPQTGKEMNVGDVTLLEPNIHAGVKYIRQIVDRYYAKESMDDVNRVLFAFAAYNAGPAKVSQLRREAGTRGLDPNIWFNNVERIASERIGRETVTYVSNIYKYYVTYLLIQGEYLERRDLKKVAGSRVPPALLARAGPDPHGSPGTSARRHEDGN